MAEATGVNLVVVQPEELKFDLTWTGGERPSSSAQLTNQTDQTVRFLVQATDPDNYEVKPSSGSVPAFGTSRINVTARGRPGLFRVEQQNISVRIFDDPPDHQEEKIVFVQKCYHPPLRHPAMCERVIRVRWVDPQIEIPILMNKAVEEVSQQNLGPARETLGEAIQLHPDVSSLLCRALVNHLLGHKEGVKRDLQEAERLSLNSEIAEGTGEHFASSVLASCIISEIAQVPTYTTEKLEGKQMIVNWSEAVIENQLLDVEMRLTPSILLRRDGNVELNVIVDSLRFEVVKSETTDSYPDHFLQSLQIVVRPTGEWSESFPKGFGLIKWSPGNEINSEVVQQGRSRGFTAGLNLGASTTANLQLNGNNTSGTTFPAFGFQKSRRDGHACVWVYELRTFEGGSSTKNLRRTRFYRSPKIPEAVQGEVNYPNLDQGATLSGKWMVSETIATKHRNQLNFTISLEAKLPAVLRCRKSSPTHLFKPPKHELEVRKVKTNRTCVFAIARLKSFIGEST